MIIHQMLHGYNHGHNYIQGSIVLDSIQDMNKIAMLSDWSEYTSDDNDSYLTCYSLDESDYYVFAKTWYASEMLRPGCVWTHSLLIRKEELVYIEDFRQLQSYFVRPSSNSDYSNQIIYDDSNFSQIQSKLDQSASSLLGQMYSSLMNGDKQLVLSAQFGEEVCQELVLQFLNYIPSGLLNEINICTGTASERPFGNQHYTILFSPTAESKSSFSDKEENKNLRRLVDAGIRDDVQMRQLIRSFDNEIGVSLDCFIAFLKLLDLLNRNLTVESEKVKNEHQIIELLSKSFPYPSEGCRLKQKFLSKNVTNFFVSEESFLFMMCLVDTRAFYKEDIHFEERVCSLFETSKEKYINLLGKIIDSSETNEWGDNLLRGSVKLFSQDDWNSLIKTNWYIYLSLAYITPSLLNYTDWQNAGKRQVIGILDILSKDSNRRGFTKCHELLDAVYAFSIQIDEGMADFICHKISNPVGEILSNTNAKGVFIDSLMKECLGKQEEVIHWMCRESSITKELVVRFIICDICPASQLVQDSNPALWHKIIYASSMPLDYYIFLFILSFNWYKDEDAIEYMKLSFMPIYESVITSTITTRQWRKLEPLMEPLKIWQDWDKGKKMRKTLGKRLKKAGFSKSYVSGFTSDDELNHEILKYWKKY